MARLRRQFGLVGVLGLVALAGCGGLLGGLGSADPTPTLTPAPVPEVTPTATPTPTPTATPTSTPTATPTTGNSSRGGFAIGARYDSLAPTCTRPPGVVIHIQVAALANNDPATNDGIRTAWRFAALSNRQYTGPYRNFVDIVTTWYRPLLDAQTVTYQPANRSGRTVWRRVIVSSGTDSTTTYRWRLRKQTGGEFDGCWMTAGVSEISPGAEP